MFRTPNIAAAISAAILTFTFPASASDESRFFVGGGISLDSIDDGIIKDGSNLGFSLQGGYALHENFSLVAGYKLYGESSGIVSNVDVALDLDAIFVKLRGKKLVSESAYVFADLGYNFWDAEATASTSSSSFNASTDGNDLSWGLGLGLKGEQYDFTLSYEAGDFEDTDFDAFEIGVFYKF